MFKTAYVWNCVVWHHASRIVSVLVFQLNSRWLQSQFWLVTATTTIHKCMKFSTFRKDFVLETFWHLFGISWIKLFIQLVLQNLLFSATIFKEIMLIRLFRCIVGSCFSLILRRCQWLRQSINLCKLMNDTFKGSSHSLTVVLPRHFYLRTVENHKKPDPVWLASTNLLYYHHLGKLCSAGIDKGLPSKVQFYKAHADSC